MADALGWPQRGCFLYLQHIAPNPAGMTPYFCDLAEEPSFEQRALDEVLAKFPATLLISGTRDSALSETLVINETLSRAVVPVELHVWEGMWHSFFSDPELPESKAAYDVIARFFDHHLKVPALRLLIGAPERGSAHRGSGRLIGGGTAGSSRVPTVAH